MRDYSKVHKDLLVHFVLGVCQSDYNISGLIVSLKQETTYPEMTFLHARIHHISFSILQRRAHEHIGVLLLLS